MARLDTRRSVLGLKPWKAEIRVRGIRRYAGWHATKEEGLQAERALRLRLTGSPNVRDRSDRLRVAGMKLNDGPMDWTEYWQQTQFTVFLYAWIGLIQGRDWQFEWYCNFVDAQEIAL